MALFWIMWTRIGNQKRKWVVILSIGGGFSHLGQNPWPGSFGGCSQPNPPPNKKTTDFFFKAVNIMILCFGRFNSRHGPPLSVSGSDSSRC